MTRIFVCLSVLTFPSIVFGQPRVAPPTFGVAGPPIGRGDVAAGRSQTILARPDGRVLAWSTRQPRPTPVDGIPPVISVASGATHTLALTEAGEVYAWGANESGQLGDGTRVRHTSPVRVVGLADVVQVSAGRRHSLAVTADGRVFAWGSNAKGQLGVGRGGRVLRPAVIATLTGVVSIDAGHSHSLAVTSTGVIWAWGANEHGQLGDGTRRDRPSPVRIALDEVTAVAAGGGHSVALRRDGTVFSWGFGGRGQLGTGSTQAAARPSPLIGLSAFAVFAGRNFSAAVRRDGTLVSWGANESGQLGDGTRLDRLTPTAAVVPTGLSAVALGTRHAVAVTATGSVLMWGGAAMPSTVLSGLVDWGPPIGTPPEVPAPTIQPASAAYPAPQLVTISGAADATIRFTLDGSDPTNASPVYASPLLVSTTTTVKARAFSPLTDVRPSAVTTHVYTIDMVPPSIIAEASPQLTGGWLTVPVTIMFRCEDDSGSVTCPAPVTVATDGAAQLIRGTAVDHAGNRATASVEVSVDLTAPTVIVDNLPGGETQEAQLTLRGRAFDSASGIAGVVRCNGNVVAIIGESFECAVNLRPGVNNVTLQAQDVVGHVAAAGVAITRTGLSSRLTIAPEFRAMVPTDNATLQLRDDFGTAITHGSWYSSDSTVVSLSADDPPLVTAMAPGTAIITAQKGGLTASATIAVHPGNELPPGTTRWRVAQSPGYGMADPIFTTRVDASVPEMFIVDSLPSGEALLRAATSEGEVLWQQHSPGVPLMGDVFGGVVAGVPYDVGRLRDFRALVRLGTAGGVRPWRYESAGRLLRPAQAPDGTIHVVEQVTGLDNRGKEIRDKHIITLDGRTGRLLHRYPVARETRVFTAALDGQIISKSPLIICSSSRSEAVPRHVDPIIGSDGRGYSLVQRSAYQSWASCLDQAAIRERRDIDLGIDMVITSADALPEVRQLYAIRCQAEEGSFPVVCDGPFSADNLMPDGIGGMLANWTRTAEFVNFTTARTEQMLTRWDAGGARTDRGGAAAFMPDWVGQDGILHRGAWSAYDVVSGEIKWTRDYKHLIALAATPAGGVLMVDTISKQLHKTDETGMIVSSQPFGLGMAAVHEFGQWIGRLDSQTAAVVGAADDAARWWGWGNRQQTMSLRTPGIGIFAKSHPVIAAALNFDHVSLRVVPTFQDFWKKLRPDDFVNRDQFGNYFMTLGAGTADGDTSVFCTGTLTKGINRDQDVRATPKNLEKLPVDVLGEMRLINDLYVAFDGYKNDLPYACVPERNPGHYNSNSFASGLLRRVQAPLPLFPLRGTTVPGWPVPVPPHKFDP